MSRSFAAGNELGIPATAAINNQNEFVWCAWIFPRTGGHGTDFGRIITKGFNAGNVKRFSLGNPDVGETGFAVNVNRDTTNYIRTTGTRVPLNKWYFVVFSFSVSSNLANIVIFNEDLTLNFQVNDSGAFVGSGTPLDDSTYDLDIGHQDGTSVFDGLISRAKVFTSYFYDLDVYRGIALEMLHSNFLPTVNLWLQGYEDPEPDYSGNGLNAAIIGTTAGNDPPIPPFEFTDVLKVPMIPGVPPPFELSLSNFAPIKKRTLGDYCDFILQLFPVGLLWDLISSKFNDLIKAISDEFNRNDQRNVDLIRESMPGLSNELLPDWESIAYTEDELATVGGTASERQAAVNAKIFNTTASPTKKFFEDLALERGVSINITFPTGFLRVGVGRVGDRLEGPGNVYVWVVDYASGSKDEYAKLEPTFRELKHAHTFLVFNPAP